MSLEKEAIICMVQSIIKTFQELINKSPHDKTVIGIIKEIDTTKGYRVLVCGSLYYIKSSLQLNIGEEVWVTVPCGNWSDMFILCKCEN